jgi:hypothetical protein
MGLAHGAAAILANSLPMRPLHGSDAAIALLKKSMTYYLCCGAPTEKVRCTIREGIGNMTTRNALSAIGGFFEVFGSAIAASRAIEANRQPRSSDLRTLGIDPRSFSKIVRR